MRYLLVVYGSTHEAMQADYALAQAGFGAYMIVPLPTGISAGCGIAIRIEWPQARRAVEVLRGEGCLGRLYASADGLQWQQMDEAALNDVGEADVEQAG